MQRQQQLHPRLGQVGLCQQPRLIGQTEQGGIMGDVAAGLKAARHDEMALMTVEPCQVCDPCLVEPGRAAKDFARQRHRGGQQGVIARHIPLGQRLQRL